MRYKATFTLPLTKVTHIQIPSARRTSLLFEALPLYSNPPLPWLRHARHLSALNPRSRSPPATMQTKNESLKARPAHPPMSQ